MATQSTPVCTDASTRPIVFLLSLDKQSWWDKEFSDLINLLTEKATVKRARKTHIALEYLANNNPSAIIVTDPAIFSKEPLSVVDDPTRSKDPLAALSKKVSEYAHEGGTVVLATTFSSFFRPLDVDRWFREAWNLPWRAGQYVRTTVYVNPECRVHQATLPAEYSQKAVFLKNVAKDAAVYLPSGSSRVESQVFPPTPVDVEEAPVVFAKIGKGWLGYVGDVNKEIASRAVVLAMCGL